MKTETVKVIVNKIPRLKPEEISIITIEGATQKELADIGDGLDMLQKVGGGLMTTNRLMKINIVNKDSVINETTYKMIQKGDKTESPKPDHCLIKWYKKLRRCIDV